MQGEEMAKIAPYIGKSLEKQAPPNFKIVSMRYVLQSGFICLISSFESKNMVRRKKNFQKNFSKFFTRPGREKATSSKNCCRATIFDNV